MDVSMWTLIQQIGMVFLVPIAGALGVLIVQKIKLAGMQVKDGIWESIKLIVKTAVFASEQKFKAGMITNRKENAMRMSKKFLADKKIKIDEDLLSELIEAEVGELKVILPIQVIQPPASSYAGDTGAAG